MPEMTLNQLVRVTEGQLVSGNGDTRVFRFGIDTRRLEPGGVFFALAGERTDGHRFLGEARRNGAAAAVVEREVEADAEVPEGLIRVDNSEQALARCGRWVRTQLKSARWVVVTGSNGKTTTKEMLAAGLAGQLRVHRTPGNFNNHLGVPLTLLACPADAQAAVIEIAMSGPGEIAMLTEMTDPDVGLVTNVRAAHLESFNSLDDIAAAKGELFAMMRDDAIPVVNLDDMHVRVQAARHPGRRVTFGKHADADVRLIDLENRFWPGASLTVIHDGNRYRADLKIGGAHAAFDALAALAAVVAVEGDLDRAIEGIQQVEAGPGRGLVHHLDREIVLVDDSYNSSPSALASVLETLRLSEPSGRRVLVSGDMLELGPISEALHREAGKHIGAARVELLFAVGPLSRATAEIARRAGVPEVHHYVDSSKAAESIADFLRDGDLIAVKGSRGMRMERVVKSLCAKFGTVC